MLKWLNHTLWHLRSSFNWQYYGDNNYWLQYRWSKQRIKPMRRWWYFGQVMELLVNIDDYRIMKHVCFEVFSSPACCATFFVRVAFCPSRIGEDPKKIGNQHFVRFYFQNQWYKTWCGTIKFYHNNYSNNMA